MRIKIPKQKQGNKLIAKAILTVPEIKSHNGEKLFLYIPLTKKELRESWNVLEGYTERMAPNPESALQDLDDIKDVIGYHFGNELAYLIFTVVDKQGKPRAIAPSEIVSIDDVLENKKPLGKGTGFIYQIAHDEVVSNKDTDFSVATALYKHAVNLLRGASTYKKEGWLGVATESRKEGPELEAIKNAGFIILIPNEFYRPPAVQEGLVVKPANLVTEDLVLLGKNVQKKFENIVANAYITYSYCEGQDIKPTLKLIKTYFKNK